MTSKIKWLADVKEILYKNEGDLLFVMIEVMYEETYYDFIYFLSEASNGEGMVVSQGIQYVLEQIDDPPGLDEVCFLLGDFVSTTITRKHFVKLMKIISDSYIKANPEDKNLVDYYMSKLKARYN